MKQQMEKLRAKNEICTKFLLRFFKLVSKYKITRYNYNQPIITIHFFAVFFFFLLQFYTLVQRRIMADCLR